MDCSCLNRPFDDMSHPTVRSEAVAIRSAMLAIFEQHWTLVSGDVLHYEIRQNPSPDRQRAVFNLEAWHSEWVAFDSELEQRATEVQEVGIDPMDALHLASAEKAKVDIFLSTDYKLLKAARRLKLSFRVMNPVDFQAGGE